MHVGTPTLNINTPPFPPNLHQAPLPSHTNRPNNNFYTNIPNANTPPHTVNTQVPPPFNPHAPPPYFLQYPATTSPSVHSNDSSILVGMARKTRYGMQSDGARKGRKKKNERRTQTEKRRQKMYGKMRKPAKKQNQQSF